MKLYQLVNELEDRLISDESTLNIYGNDLLSIEKELKKTDEFKNCELKIINNPILKTESLDSSKKNLLIEKLNEYNTKILDCESVLCTDKEYKFENKVYLLSIATTPEFYNSQMSNEPVKDRASVTPPIFNFLDFTSYRIFNIEIDEHDLKKNKKQIIKDSKKLIEKVINNLDEYSLKGERKIMIRGVFEKIKFNGEVIKDEKYNVILNAPFFNVS